MKFLRPGLIALALLASAAIYMGCEVDSADTFSRDVATDFSGLYKGCDDGPIVSGISGSNITSLDLRQSGDTLEAVDNNGGLWRGSLGEVQGGRSSFELKGSTTGGAQAWFSGTLDSTDGGNTNVSGASTGYMRGTFIQGDRYRTFCGSATIRGTRPEPQPTPTNDPPPTLTVQRATSPQNSSDTLNSGYAKMIQRLIAPDQRDS